MNSLPFHLSITKTGPNTGVPAWKAPLETTFMINVPSWSQPWMGQHMQSKNQLPLGDNSKMDLCRTQLSLVWDMEIHILQLLQRLPQVGEETKASEQQHRGQLHLGNCLSKKPIQISIWTNSAPLCSWDSLCTTHTLRFDVPRHWHTFFSTAADSKPFNKWHSVFWEVFPGILLDHSTVCVSTDWFYSGMVLVLDSFAGSWALWASSPAWAEPPSQDGQGNLWFHTKGNLWFHTRGSLWFHTKSLSPLSDEMPARVGNSVPLPEFSFLQTHLLDCQSCCIKQIMLISRALSEGMVLSSPLQNSSQTIAEAHSRAGELF